jgi:hypothetical protein
MQSGDDSPERASHWLPDDEFIRLGRQEFEDYRRRPVGMSSGAGDPGASPENPATGTAVIGELSVQAEAQVAAELAVTVSRWAFPPEWESDRQEAIRLLTNLPQALQDADEALKIIQELRRRNIGGNHPPEAIENADTDILVTETAVAGDALLAELSADQPHLVSIRLSGMVLQRCLRGLETTAGWLAEKGDLFVGEFVKQMGKLTADTIGLAGLIAALGWLIGILSPVLSLVRGLLAHFGIVL